MILLFLVSVGHLWGTSLSKNSNFRLLKLEKVVVVYWGLVSRECPMRRQTVLRVVSSAGFEPTAPRLGIWCSILLSYEDKMPALLPL